MNKTELLFKFNAPLHKADAPDKTYGCRAYNPNICSNADIPQICAFVRSDGMCMKPSRAWKKQFYKLLNKNDKEDNNEISQHQNS